jgi:hypothetical protein
MAWTQAARDAAAMARKMHTANPKPSKGDFYARVKQMKRDTIAEGLKWGRKVATGKAFPPSRPGSMDRSFLHAYEAGKASKSRK